MKEIIPQTDLREQVKEKVVKALSDYLQTDTETTVSQAQLETYKMVVDAIPEGKLKEFAQGLEGAQNFSSKFNEKMLAFQDKTWGLARAVVIARFPLAALIPKNPFSKIAIKSSQIQGKVSETIVRFVTKNKKRVE